MIGRRASLWATVFGLAVVAAAVAAAHIALPEPVARAAAKVNRDAKRAQALRIPVAVIAQGAEAPSGTGTLLASPDAKARLEVRHSRGFVERQLRRSGGVSAARDGQLLDQPRPLLPPMWVLQVRSGARLLARLGELGGNPGVVSLGYDGAHDCYVLGGRDGPAFWVDQDTLAVVRIDLAGGVVYRLGPVEGEEDGVALPGWIEMEQPGVPTLRLELGSPSAVSPPDDAFRPEWLTAPE